MIYRFFVIVSTKLPNELVWLIEEILSCYFCERQHDKTQFAMAATYSNLLATYMYTERKTHLNL